MDLEASRCHCGAILDAVCNRCGWLLTDCRCPRYARPAFIEVCPECLCVAGTAAAACPEAVA